MKTNISQSRYCNRSQWGKDFLDTSGNDEEKTIPGRFGYRKFQSFIDHEDDFYYLIKMHTIAKFTKNQANVDRDNSVTEIGVMNLCLDISHLYGSLNIALSLSLSLTHTHTHTHTHT
jgi:hypothetical protein